MPPSPLPRAREFVLAGFLYLATALAFLWPVVTPRTIATNLQELDSTVSVAIVSHTARALVGRDAFWNLEIFYPHADTLCLSDPMLAEAILTGPIKSIAGPVVAHNLYLYFTSWAIAFSTWLFLRHRRLEAIPAFLGGLLTGFTIGRLMFLAGQSHLLFQAGFALTLLAAERSLMQGTSRLWPVVWIVAFLFQVLEGFFMIAIFALWCVLIPASVWRGAGGALSGVLARGRRILTMVLGLALAAVVTLPLAMKYRDFSHSAAENPLSVPARLSSNWRSYVFPPHDLVATLPGVWLKDARLVEPGALESITFIGWTTLFLCALGGAGALWRFCQPVRGPWLRIEGPFALSLCAVVLVGGILSVGPFLGQPDATHPQGAGLLPFGYLYSHFSSFRFFRIPARFSIPVVWGSAIVAAYGLNWLLARFHETWFRICAGVFFVLLAGFEHFPARAVGRAPALPTPSTRRLMAETAPKPIVIYPNPDMAQLLSQAAWHGVSTVNGFSGYSPPGYVSEMRWFEDHFPSPESFLLFERWGIDRVLISNAAPDEARDAARSSGLLTEEWSADDGAMFRLTGRPELFESYMARRRAAFAGAASPLVLVKDFATSNVVRAWEPTLRESPDSGERPVYRNPGGVTAIAIRFSEPIDPARFTHLRMRVRIENWFPLRDEISAQWATAAKPELDAGRAASIPLLCDGQYSDASIALGECIAWVTEDPVTELRIVLGKNDGNAATFEDLWLESDSVQWALPIREE